MKQFLLPTVHWDHHHSDLSECPVCCGAMVLETLPHPALNSVFRLLVPPSSLERKVLENDVFCFGVSFWGYLLAVEGLNLPSVWRRDEEDLESDLQYFPLILSTSFRT